MNLDEDKKPSLGKLTRRIWARYQRGSERHNILPRDGLEALETCIGVSLNAAFDYRRYLPAWVPRDEAMRLIKQAIETKLKPRIYAQRRAAALCAAEQLEEIGPIQQPT